MGGKPSYEELERKLRKIERDSAKRKEAEKALKESEERARRQRAAIADLVQDPSVAAGEMPEAVRRITETLSKTMEVGRASVRLLSEDASELQCFSLFEGEKGKHSKGAVFKTSFFPSYFQALLAESRIVANRAREDPRTCELTGPYLAPMGIASLLDAGIQIEGKLVGVFSLETVGEARQWQPDEEAFAATAAAMVAQIIANDRRRRAEAALRAKTEELDRYFTSSLDLLCIADTDGYFRRLNSEWERTLGYSLEDLENKRFMDFVHPDDRDATLAVAAKLQRQSPILNFENRYRCKDGSYRWIEWRSLPAGKLIYAAARDITERKRAETELRESERRMAQIIEFLPDATFVIDMEGKVTAWNRGMETLTGLRSADMAGKGGFAYAVPFYGKPRPVLIDLAMKPDPEIAATYVTYHQDGERLLSETYLPDFMDRGPTWLWNTASPLHDPEGRIVGAIESIRDITHHKNAEEEGERLQAQLNQAQRMESVGRLAGGVAHDFNNMLQAILGHTELALGHVEPGGPVAGDLQEIRKSAERSADLVRQLLAFARRQTISPKVLDLNNTVEGTLKMLQRLIGEDIDLAWLPERGLWRVKVDPGQIDQILANLAVNARDAIEGVGKLTIETGNVFLDKTYCIDHAGFVPGEYVLLAVSDNGAGMAKEALEHLFEPFFTTKEVGKGTGLGLATVYGIVKQNDGFINVYSEPGRGTTFKIYLPRHRAGSSQESRESRSEPAPRGQETVLLVEDEPAILEMITKMLERQGYTVLAARTPGEAVRLAGEHPSEIHLLVTDVVMPEMNGRELAKRLLSLHPRLKKLFMSGYTANVIAHHGVLDEAVHFLQKPFSMKDLASKVRDTIDAES